MFAAPESYFTAHISIAEMQGRGFDEYYPSKTQDRPSTLV